MCRKEACIPLGSEQGTSLQTSLAALAQRVWVPPPMQGEWHGADQHRARQRGNCSPKGQQTAGNIGKERACPEEHKNTPNGRKYLTFLPPEKILDWSSYFHFVMKSQKKIALQRKRGCFTLTTKSLVSSRHFFFCSFSLSLESYTETTS